MHYHAVDPIGQRLGCLSRFAYDLPADPTGPGITGFDDGGGEIDAERSKTGFVGGKVIEHGGRPAAHFFGPECLRHQQADGLCAALRGSRAMLFLKHLRELFDLNFGIGRKRPVTMGWRRRRRELFDCGTEIVHAGVF